MQSPPPQLQGLPSNSSDTLAWIIAAQRKALIQNVLKRAAFSSHSGKHQNFIWFILHFQPWKINGRILQNLLLSTIILVGFFRHEYRHFFFRRALEAATSHYFALPSQFYNIYTLESICKSLKHRLNHSGSIAFLTFCHAVTPPSLFSAVCSSFFLSCAQRDKKVSLTQKKCLTFEKSML